MASIFCLPCLDGILPQQYLENEALLAEGTYILLGDCITVDELKRAELLLDAFYRNFVPLYGEGSCGLNVHNVGAHLTDCVRLFGPLWAWSCFGFEDSNSMILHAVHGTGNVAKQIMQYRSALGFMRSSSLFNHTSTKQWKKKLEVDGCLIPETPKSLPNNEDTPFILQKIGAPNGAKVHLAQRVQVDGKKFYSQRYTRMKKKICYAILTNSGKMALVKFFIIHVTSGKVFAVIQILPERTDSPISGLNAGKHLMCVSKTDVEVIPVHRIKEKVFFIQAGDCASIFVAHNPNSHGHAVFK